MSELDEKLKEQESSAGSRARRKLEKHLCDELGYRVLESDSLAPVLISIHSVMTGDSNWVRVGRELTEAGKHKFWIFELVPDGEDHGEAAERAKAASAEFLSATKKPKRRPGRRKKVG